LPDRSSLLASGVIEVVFNRGIYLPELDFWLDPWDVKESAFVSHAHADHFARHGNALCSALTAKLLRARFNMAEQRLEAVEFGVMIDRGGFRLRMLPAGHIAGSAMLHVTRKKDGATLLYTGDFKARRGRTTEAVNFLQADTLIMETTFGLPNLVFPSAMETDAAVMRFVNDALADGETPVLFAYSLGKAQEAVALLAENGIPVLSHPKVAEMTDACRAAGINLPEPVVFEGFGREGHAVIAPPNAVAAKLLRGLKNKRTAMLTGWALQPGAFYRYRVEAIIAMSDHADHAGLHECVTRVRPKRVITVHGYTKEFAAELRAKGIEAWCAMGGDQLELPLGKSVPTSLGAANPRHSRPICQLADFSDACRLIGETSSRLAKVEFLVNYLRGLEVDDDLETVTRWLTGEALAGRFGTSRLKVSNAAIKRSLASVPGVKPERYRAVTATRDDIFKIGRTLLQEVTLSPKPLKISVLNDLLLNILRMEESLEAIELLSNRLFELHPSEGELVIKLLTGDLRIGLKDGLVEEAVGIAFGVNSEDLGQANMVTGDLGRTAVLAKSGRLSEASMTPLVPIRCMLVSPLEPADENGVGGFGGLPFAPPFWLEPDCGGIRTQLHKKGDEVGLFSVDLQSLGQDFPELVEAAKSLAGDFILDGNLIAYAEGHKLGSADLRNGMAGRREEGDLFTEGRDGLTASPLRFFAFDLLWEDGDNLIGLPLVERRMRLEKMGLDGMLSCVDLFRAHDEDEVETCFGVALMDGHEGLIAKDPAGTYRPGRPGNDWIGLWDEW
jgi:DNA ligase-1